jgi:hypothetical protein
MAEKRTRFKTSATRHTLEDCWRLRLEGTEAHYRKATERYRKLLREQPDGAALNPSGAVALARQAESEALAEYTRVLRIFTELTVNGKVQDDHSVAGSNGL